MTKILTVVGARPQFIKAAMLSREIAQTDGLDEVIVHTGQHYDHGMSDVFFEEMKIPHPAYNLGVGGGSHGAMTGRQLEGIERVIMDEKPDCLLVYGDTNSTLAGALAAAKLHVPVAHVEAGLRSHNRRMPEEINRVMADHVSTWLFTPSLQAGDNLKAEGITDGVHFVGDIMYDAALVYGEEVSRQDRTLVDEIGLEAGQYRLATVHRQENVAEAGRLRAICDAFRALAEEMPLVLPMHPRLRKEVEAAGGSDTLLAGVTIIDPVGFKDMIALLRGASAVATDSGGVQKEAYFHGAPVIVLRDETEWTELVDLGVARLSPPVSAESIVEQVHAGEAADHTVSAKPYGEGRTAAAIVSVLGAM